ncbi:MAG: hypothetical protein ACFBZ9_08535 [Sphingomonadales bacterium]
MTEKIELQKKARGQRPEYFADPAIDKVLSITMALAGEMAVMRDRLDTIERLMEDGTPVTSEAINSYQPDAQVRSQRDAWRETFLDIVLRRIHQEREELDGEATTAKTYSEAIARVEKE